MYQSSNFVFQALTGKAIKFMGESFKEAPPGNPNMLFVITQSGSSDDTTGPAVQLRKDGIKVISFGMGEKVDAKQLTLTAHSSTLVFMAKKEALVTSLSSCQSATARGEMLF